jgi:Mg-chelatase subunit ChlD
MGDHFNYIPPPVTTEFATSSTNSNGKSFQAWASATPIEDVSSSSTIRLNIDASQRVPSQQAIDSLKQQGFTRGLITSMTLNKREFPIRMWIVDNSGSMRASDGNKIVRTKKNEMSLISGVSRWVEMQQTVEYHANLAATLQAPTIFRLLNDPGIVAGPQQFSVADNGYENSDRDLAVALQTMANTSPSGATPLTQHVREIRQNILALEHELRTTGTRIAIIIATDGLPSDNEGNSTTNIKNEFEQELRSLAGLPVWVVVRLCTDEEDVVNYWNNIDQGVQFLYFLFRFCFVKIDLILNAIHFSVAVLELNMEVLDDFASEAKEVQTYNKWLNYTLPLHRLREMGFYDNILDLLDEKKLSKDEVIQFCKLLFGPNFLCEVSVDPYNDWNGFCTFLGTLMKNEQKQWNPVRRRMEPWIDINILKREFAKNGFWRNFI